MKGVNFTFNEAEAFEQVLSLIGNIFMEESDWDFEVVITKEKDVYEVWIGNKDE